MDSDLSTELFGQRGDPFAGHTRYQRVGAALKIIGIGRSKLYSLLRQGRIRAKKLDNLTYIDMHSVSTLFAACPQISPAHHAMLTLVELGLTKEPVQAVEQGAEDHPLNGLRLGADDFAG